MKKCIRVVLGSGVYLYVSFNYKTSDVSLWRNMLMLTKFNDEDEYIMPLIIKAITTKYPTSKVQTLSIL